jgi:CDP-diacylglycerol--serine O-phosphatidyltransferase
MASIIMDMVDGRIARMTNTTSRFGLEFDSLSDLISFGVAPAVLMYQMVLSGMNNPGIAIALFYVIAGALRLARFNVKAQDGESCTEFSGLPIPAAAGMLASFVLSYELFLNDSSDNEEDAFFLSCSAGYHDCDINADDLHGPLHGF